MHFARKFSRGFQAQERALLGYVSVYENTPKKLIHLPVKVETTLLGDSRKGAIGV